MSFVKQLQPSRFRGSLTRSWYEFAEAQNALRLTDSGSQYFTRIVINFIDSDMIKTEIIVALFGLGGTVLGALIGAVVSAITAKQQVGLSLKQLKVEMIQSQILLLRNVLSSISSVEVDVSDPSLTIDQIHSRSIDSFLRRAKLFMDIAYLFPSEFEERTSQICKEINQCIYRAKTSQPIDEESSRTLN
jgi:hypothetical protein